MDRQQPKEGGGLGPLRVDPVNNVPLWASVNFISRWLGTRETQASLSWTTRLGSKYLPPKHCGGGVWRRGKAGT